ncbi:MAG: hypothetical protein LQ345_000176 [Seirophora villosa]|nr:MAG: hypothetical protein LQ345_000176 [Seirophora villosa]
MPKNLAKVQKKIAKKKGNVSSLHENSRDARRLRRAGASYLARDSAELSTLQASRRSGRPTSTREDTLKQQMDAEAKEYVSGLWLPDMEDPETVEKLKDWSGEWMNLNTLKFARVKQDGTRHASSFPPKGQS